MSGLPIARWLSLNYESGYHLHLSSIFLTSPFPSLSTPMPCSGQALGATLTQNFQDGEHPVVFPVGCSIKRRRIIPQSIASFLLFTGPSPTFAHVHVTNFQVVSDHRRPLMGLLRSTNLSSRQARLVHKLAEYSFTLHHRAGTSNQNADTLSRPRVSLMPFTPFILNWRRKCLKHNPVIQIWRSSVPSF